jgi:hypothetical protein
MFDKKNYSVELFISFKCILKVGVDESIVNAPLVSQQGKNTNNAESEVRFFNSWSVICNPWCVHNRLFKVIWSLYKAFNSIIGNNRVYGRYIILFDKEEYA